MILYAIRHKPTRHYLPQVPNGHTHITPRDCSTTDWLPRLHTTHKSAAIALSLWLNGALCSIHNEYNQRIGLKWQTMMNRNRDEMEIVRMNLEEADGDNRDDGADSSSVANRRRADPTYTEEDWTAYKRTSVCTDYC